MLNSNETLLAEAHCPQGRLFLLTHVAEGIVPAGSGTRVQDEAFGVHCVNKDGTRSGRLFRTYNEATREFIDRIETTIFAK